MAATDAQIVAGAGAAIAAAGLSVGLWRQDPVESDEFPIALLLPITGQGSNAGTPHYFEETVTLRVSLFAGSRSAESTAEADLGAVLEAMDETVRVALLARPRGWAAGVKEIPRWRYNSSLVSPNADRLMVGRRIDFDVTINGTYADTYDEISFDSILLQVKADRTPLPDDPDAEQLIEVPT